ncbi:MAG: RNA methyltransferase [Mariniblastus sp.]|nr:RNA methyltransferase [Mariniblastus sp.]
MNGQPIRSENNPKYKSALRLHSSRGRKQQGRIIIFGLQEIERACRADVDIVEVFFEEGQALPGFLESSAGASFYPLPPLLFRKLAFGDRHDGVVVVARQPESDLSAMRWSDDALVVVLQGIEKPGNLGAIFRSADGAGADAVLLADSLTGVFHPNSIRASLGTVFSMRTASADSQTIRGHLQEHGFQVLAACLESEQNYYEFDLQQRTALVLGNENLGLTDDWRTGETRMFQLPMRGQADSLNVSSTAAILVYEAMRQRRTRVD